MRALSRPSVVEKAKADRPEPTFRHLSQNQIGGGFGRGVGVARLEQRRLVYYAAFTVERLAVDLRGAGIDEARLRGKAQHGIGQVDRSE